MTTTTTTTTIIWRKEKKRRKEKETLECDRQMSEGMDAIDSECD